MSDVDYARMADYFDGLIRENGVKSGIFLDLACGTGSLSVLMAEKGWDVIAVDSSAEMLSLAPAHENVSYICQDMNELDLFGTVDAAVCSLDGLNHLRDEPQVLNVLEKAALFMNEGGVLVFDVNTLYKHETILGDNIFVKEVDGVCCIWRNSYIGNGVVEISLDIFNEEENGDYSRHCAEFSEKAYELRVIQGICEQAGFETIACYDYMSKNEVKEISEKAVFVCKLKKSKQKNPV
jgi:SAM-dependent methyltransferase